MTISIDARAGVAPAFPTEAVRFLLEPHSVMSLLPTRGGLTIRCVSGRLWITQTGNGRDFLLESGGSFSTWDRHRVVVEALNAATLRIDGAGSAS